MELIYEIELETRYKVDLITSFADNPPTVRRYWMTGEEVMDALKAERDGGDLVIGISHKEILASYRPQDEEGSKRRIAAVKEAIMKSASNEKGGTE